jgi:hypothetical protein
LQYLDGWKLGQINSTVITPQFMLILAKKKSDTVLEAFFAAGVNYSGGNDLKGDYGKIIGSSLKFKISGEPKVGFAACGEIPMTWYGPLPGSGGNDVAANNHASKLLDELTA